MGSNTDMKPVDDDSEEKVFISTENDDSIPVWQLARYRLSFLTFIGFTILTMLRFNLSLAIVAMATDVIEDTTEETITNLEETCYEYIPINRSLTGTSEMVENVIRYEWDTVNQGYVLASFFYGYVCTQVAGGLMADRYSPCLLFGSGVSGIIILTLLTPVAAGIEIGSYKIGGIFALRFLQGMSSGLAMPAPSTLWASWAPTKERGKLAGFAFSGTTMGIILSQFFTGMIINSIGWQTSFYVLGGVSALWIPLWFSFASDTPDKCRSISSSEKKYLETIGSKLSSKGGPVPWLNIILSLPFWAIMAAHFSYNYMLYTFLTILPMYLKKVQGLNLSTGGYVSTIPYVCQVICIAVQAKIAQYIYDNDLLAVTTVRRIANSIALYVPAVCLVIIGTLGCNTAMVIVVICVCIFFSGFSYSGYLNPNVLDLAPNFAGTLFGVTNTFANLPGFIAPQVAVYFIKGRETTLTGWAPVWVTSMIVTCTGATIYALTASGNKQPWNDQKMPVCEQLQFEKKQFIEALLPTCIKTRQNRPGVPDRQIE